MSTSDKAWFDSFAAYLPEWVGRRVSLTLGSHAAGSAVVSIDAVLAWAHHAEDSERGSDQRETVLFLQADETVVLTIVEDMLDPESWIEPLGFQAGLAGVTAELSVVSEAEDLALPSSWSDAQREQVIRLVEGAPWGDIENGLFDFELCLDRAIAATPGAAEDWAEVERVWGADEYSLTPDQVASLGSEQLIAYLGQLVRMAKMRVGSRKDGGSEHGSPLALLQDLGLTAHDLHVD